MTRYETKSWSSARTMSWSESARFLSNKMYIYYSSGILREEDVVRFFQNSHRAPLVIHRAAKRFGRMVRNRRQEL